MDCYLNNGKNIKDRKGTKMSENKINLLIVDDEEQFLNSISKSLTVRGFNVIAVNRGEKAIEIAKIKPIDIALVDLKMPGISGEETLKVLKQEHKWMEIVILTGHGSVDSAVQCTQKGAYTYLQKPCELEKLLEALKDAYEKRVMNKHNIEEKKMKEMLKLAMSDSPREIIRRLQEIDKGE